MNIGQAIKRIRLEKGINQSDLAKECVISQTAFSQIENGISRPSAKNLKKICDALEIPEPILYLYALEDSDIPERKKQLFNELFPSVREMIKSLVLT